MVAGFPEHRSTTKVVKDLSEVVVHYIQDRICASYVKTEWDSDPQNPRVSLKIVTEAQACRRAGEQVAT